MSRKFALLEAACSAGAPRTGTELAYDVLAQHGLVELFGDALTYRMEQRESTSEYPENLLRLSTVMEVCEELRANALDALARGYFPVSIGGDHSIAMGTLAAYGETYGAENLALIYIDAHPDLNTEQTSDSHCIHGMDLASACGITTPLLQVGTQRVNLLGENIYIIGARSIDEPEYAIMEELGVHYYTPDTIRERGLAAILEEIQDGVRGKTVHVSFDVDSLDPSVFTATGYVLQDGLTREQLLEVFAATLPLASSFECVEYNPMLDADGKDCATLLELLQHAKDLLTEAALEQ